MKAKLELKPGVTGSAEAPLQAALEIACVVYGWFGFSSVTVTSLRDGEHMAGSLHSRGYAADLRTSTVGTARLPALVKALKGQLGPAYDVVLEKDHIHLEFDPEHNGGANLP